MDQRNKRISALGFIKLKPNNILVKYNKNATFNLEGNGSAVFQRLLIAWYFQFNGISFSRFAVRDLINSFLVISLCSNC